MMHPGGADSDNATHDEAPGGGERPQYFDAEGRPVTPAAYAELRRDRGYRTLARDRAGDVEVITAWLGTDQGYGYDPGQPPLIFGTMPRRVSTGVFLDHLEMFAATADEALANHAAMVARLGAQ